MDNESESEYPACSDCSDFDQNMTLIEMDIELFQIQV